jgi:hypothetical protein
MKRPMFYRSTERGTTTWLLALILLPSVAMADSGRVVARPAQTFRGWGMSLAWEAKDLYGGGRQTAQIKDPGIQSQYMDLLFGDPAARLTLGFTIARYNIAGGDNPVHKQMRADAQMEGFQSGPNAPFDWTRNASQRRMLQEAKKRGANIFEAASYSPPYWMTFSGCSSGAKVGHQDTRASYLDVWPSRVAEEQSVEGPGATPSVTRRIHAGLETEDDVFSDR